MVKIDLYEPYVEHKFGNSLFGKFKLWMHRLGRALYEESGIKKEDSIEPAKKNSGKIEKMLENAGYQHVAVEYERTLSPALKDMEAFYSSTFPGKRISFLALKVDTEPEIDAITQQKYRIYAKLD